jgi:hypothetical protein
MFYTMEHRLNLFINILSQCSIILSLMIFIIVSWLKIFGKNQNNVKQYTFNIFNKQISPIQNT